MRAIVHAAVLTALLNAGPALAGVITIDFEDQLPVIFVQDNLVSKGFQFSPSQQYHLLPASFDSQGTNWPSQWLGWDISGEPIPSNPNYTGIPPNGLAMWVNYFGKSFSFLSVIPLAQVGNAEWTVTSSNGGSFYPDFQNDRTVIDFSGPLWTDITWLLFAFPFEAHAGFAHGFDNIAFGVREEPTRTIPEPATMLLAGLGLAFLAYARRKRRSQ